MSDRTLGSDAARAVGRFDPAGERGYRAATAPGAPVRATRDEAVEDERQWLDRPRPALTTDLAPTARRVLAPAEPTAPTPFPAARMETAARAKAWRDLLAQVQFSLMVWQIDAGVRADCEDVRTWLRRCRDDLGRWAA